MTSKSFSFFGPTIYVADGFSVYAAANSSSAASGKGVAIVVESEDQHVVLRFSPDRAREFAQSIVEATEHADGVEGS